MSIEYYNEHLKGNLEYKKKKAEYDKAYSKKNKERKKEQSKQYRIENAEVIKARKAADFQKNKQRYRDNWTKNVLRWRFGITIEQYNKLLADQGGVCRICGQFRLNKSQRRMDVDHCHKTGKIRGILCNWCNVAIDRAGDNVEILYNAIRYLQDNGSHVDIGEIIDISKFSINTGGGKPRRWLDERHTSTQT